ncbi:murein hydrolase LrgA [Sporosarcina newyorkensis 2681]|uniref:Murein hydrolase LrgA n=1 Tax=Sporosarcina newyorkensis 2681 TaxID=1027292 RepID=F9DNK5_9BACL|nr:CidA/LrgA family holin-like protein [Sporosarcina newyorkensis]EGQ27639.1 murein hydrolase LrgA [Sporosarcina newyorkensis 2681]
MKIVKTLIQVVFLYLFFMLGNFLRQWLSIPLPGSIIGLLILWGLLSFRIIPLNWVEKGAYVFLSTLPLYLIPATVGVMNYGHVFRGKGVLLVVITIVSTFITMAVASLVSQSMAKRNEKDEVELS